MKKFLLVALLAVISSRPSLAQNKIPEGLWKGFDGEWVHVSSQLVALAEATPEEKFSWRPAPGVRSTSEVYMHIAVANLRLAGLHWPQNARGFEKKEWKNPSLPRPK